MSELLNDAAIDMQVDTRDCVYYPDSDDVSTLTEDTIDSNGTPYGIMIAYKIVKSFMFEVIK